MTSCGCSERGRSLLHAMLLLLALHAHAARCYQYKVGDLDAWGLPPSANPLVYALWSQKYSFRIGDSLRFLYPPSQDSVVQVTQRAYNSCDVADPILKMNDGNSVFNITAPGRFYFTSGVPGHCQKHQKLEVAVPTANGTFFPPAADAPATALPSSSPMYPTVFGPTTQPSFAASVRISVTLVAAAIGGSALFWVL